MHIQRHRWTARKIERLKQEEVMRNMAQHAARLGWQGKGQVSARVARSSGVGFS